MFKVVVISKDQPEYIPQFEKALDGIEHLYVLDRCTLEYPRNLNIIENTEGEGFLAAKARNMGAECFPDSDILFLDGDKPPVYGNVEILEKYPEFDCILIGCEDDLRLKLDNHMFVDDKTIEYKITDPDLLYNYTYSCGMLLRKNLIDYLKTLNDGYVFNPVFYGNFGEEDTWTGDCIAYSYDTKGFKMATTREVILAGKVDAVKQNTPEFYSRYSQLVYNLQNRMNLRFKYFSTNL